LIAFLGAVAEAPTTGLLVIVGRTLQTIERNIIDPLQSKELFGPLAAHVIHTPGSPTAKIFGRTVHLIGASDARAEGRIRGSTIGLAYVDEATLVPEPFWMMLLSRLRVPRARLLATTNPDGPAHWLRQNFILRAAEVNMRVFEFRIADNPSLTAEYIRDLAAQYVGLWRRRFIDGEWCVAEGAVYDMFDPDRHVIHGRVPQLAALPGVGVDYGTTNAFSAHMLGVAGAGAARGLPTRLVLTREYRHDPRQTFVQKTDAQFSTELRGWIGNDQPEWVAVDPSATSFKVQLFHDGLTNVVNARNDVLDGIRLVGSLLHAGHLQIHESCTGLLDELPGYSWDPKAALRGEDKPVKVDDHGVDSARYAIATTEQLWRPHLPIAA
jgi:PBSX family phage terminase large subunit